MAERCPESNFIGKATLRGYRWQINQRHVANIVKLAEDSSSISTAPADVVEGLVFSITDKDRRTLDRKEGIKTGIYERVVLDVLLERHPKFSEEQTEFVRDKLQDDSDAINRLASCKETLNASQEENLTIFESHDTGENAADLPPKPAVLSATPPPSAESFEEIKAITYLSTKYAENGLIRLEYVQRMENAIRDAMELDVSRDFVQRYLEPYVHGDVYEPVIKAQNEPSISNPVVSEKILKERERKAKSGLSSTREQPTTLAPRSDQAHQAHLNPKNSQGLNSIRQLLQNKDKGDEKKESRRTRPETDLGGQVSSKEQDKGPDGG